jgi:short-subunit dehydrogenase
MDLVIITGASSGIGAEYAKQVCARFRPKLLWLIARREEKLVSVAHELTSLYGTNIKIFPLDLSKFESIKIIESELTSSSQKVSLLINNAGMGKFGGIEEISLEDHWKMISLNVSAVIALSRICLPFMAPKGAIIQIASIAGLVAFPRFATYAATKTFVIYWSKALQEELRFSSKKEIVIQTVCPGPVESEFFEIASTYQKRKDKRFAPAQNVVRLSLNQLEKRKSISIYGLPMNVFYWIYRWLPARITYWLLRLTNKT